MTTSRLPDDFRFEADAVAIGASAGGIDALFTLLQGLEPPAHAAIVVVLHLPEQHESRLAHRVHRAARISPARGG